MDLDKRKNRLKMAIEFEVDKVLIKGLKMWHKDQNVIFQADGTVGMDDSKRLLLEHFPGIKHNKERLGRLGHLLRLFQTFEDAVIEFDGLTIAESGNIVQEILDSIE